ncbi:MAG TPA: ethanolamine ammonia-lyase reactivating factor EutA [Chloroflexota bacterium]|nr:ethanolamine ammonia-lyase reactivating factor EutA [Chloroflexota bacterium]
MDEARFTAPDRQMGEEDRIRLTSVGVDIGSSTSHLLFSRLELERQDNRYVTVSRTVLHESDILFTPYVDETTIDGAALGRFIHAQYEAAGLRREDVDTGALILTGVALLRENARAIADLFAEEAGKFVAVSAGDNLEATMAAHGSGAAERSVGGGRTILNVDVGGGTTKLAVCQGGRVEELAAIDVGARLVVVDESGTITRLEPAGHDIGRAIGLDLRLGGRVAPEELRAMADYMADAVYQAIPGDGRVGAPGALLRTPALHYRGPLDGVTFSGGVAEFVYGRQRSGFGDLGDLLAAALRERVERADLPLLEPAAGIRATVIGASQYTIQVSGSTIFVSPLEVLPLRNVPVVAPAFPLDETEFTAAAVQGAVDVALRRFDLADADTPVALAFSWQGSATYRRLHAFCEGIVAGMERSIARGHPIVLVCDGDIGGLLGLHFRDDMGLALPVVSIDGIDLREFDYIDIGNLIPTSGAVPVVIKSLVFPTAAAKV